MTYTIDSTLGPELFDQETTTTRGAAYDTVVGTVYRIVTQNTLDFTSVGSPDNTPGTVFIATSVDTLGAGDELSEITAPNKGIPTKDPWPALADSEALSTDFTVGWGEIGAGASIIDADSFSTTGGGGIWIDGLVPGTLYRMDFAWSNSGGGLQINGTDTSFVGKSVLATSSPTTIYHIPIATEVRVYIRNNDAATTDFTAFSVRPVQISWVPYGTNTIEIDETSDYLKVSFADDDKGAKLALANANDLTADLTVGTEYLVTFDALYAVDDGADPEAVIYSQADAELTAVTLTTSAVSYELVFTATHATGDYIAFDNMSGSETVSIRNLSIKAIDAPGTLITSAEGEMIQGIQWVDDDSSVAPMQDGAELILTINGITHQVDIADVSGQLQGAIAWEMEMPQPIRVHSLVVNSLVGGTLYIWTA